jgi:hypothetical protein
MTPPYRIVARGYLTQVEGAARADRMQPWIAKFSLQSASLG